MRTLTEPAGNLPDLRRMKRPGLAVGAAAAVLAVLGAVLNVRLFLHAYLTAYWFWLAIALGCLGVLMLQNLTGGLWGALIRRPLEAGARTLPLLAVLFLPVLIGMFVLYPWTQPGGLGSPALPAFKQVYLSVPFFIVRAIIYFAVWLYLARRLTAWSLQRDTQPDPSLTRRMLGLSAVGLVVFGLTTTFAAFDWLMSLEPSWSSSIFGAMISMEAMLTGFAFAILLLARWAREEPFVSVVSRDAFNNLGSLLLAFLMLWAYLAFSQLILMYAGNLIDEVFWYVQRIQGGWVLVAAFIGLFGFILPFAFLILRGVKRDRRLLAWVCVDLIVAHYVHLYWIVQPAFPGDSPLVIVYNVILAVAIGGLWLALFARTLSRSPLIASNDPQLISALATARPAEVQHE
jgi:hypothetical protein